MKQANKMIIFHIIHVISHYRCSSHYRFKYTVVFSSCKYTLPVHFHPSFYTVFISFEKPVLMNAFQSMQPHTSHMMTSCVCAKEEVSKDILYA